MYKHLSSRPSHLMYKLKVYISFNVTKRKFMYFNTLNKIPHHIFMLSSLKSGLEMF